MAKKNKGAEGSENEKNIGSKITVAIIVLVVILIWLVVFALLIKLDVNGLGSSVLRPLIKDIPVVNRILPDVSEEQLAYENDYPYDNLEEAIKKIKELEVANDALTKTSDSNAKTVKEQKAEIARLKVYEKDQKAFEEKVKEFDEKVVFADQAPSIDEYKKYYESIDPTNAEEIYRQVVEQLQYSNAIKEKADIYRKMKADAAAKILETMTADIDTVAQMLLSMNASESSGILAAMDPTAAAKITKKMIDMDSQLVKDK
ncbi:MotE family protein [Anaerocolumna jejuensis]|uniref:MotE family protein n=1 Tax=Anaerocolumna jejuensis TaxID=259063 RepID=UPI003F7BADAF